MYPQNNWLDIMYNNAFIMEHNMRFSGGDDKYTYSVSLGYGDQNGVLRGTDSNKYTLAVNTTAQVNSRLKIGANINAHYQIYNEPVAGVANAMRIPLSVLLGIISIAIRWRWPMRARTSISPCVCWRICLRNISFRLISFIT